MLYAVGKRMMLEGRVNMKPPFSYYIGFIPTA
jgi:hypothetical protein